VRRAVGFVIRHVERIAVSPTSVFLRVASSCAFICIRSFSIWSSDLPWLALANRAILPSSGWVGRAAGKAQLNHACTWTKC
jgi:hypothetical protein